MNGTTPQHTPGPWKYGFESVDPEWAIVTTAGGSIVANVNSLTGPDAVTAPAMRHMPCEANARLISAAPELLAELEANRVTLARLCMAVLQLDTATAQEIARDVQIEFSTGEPKAVSPAIAKAEGCA